MRAVDGRFELLDHDPAGHVVAERVEDDPVPKRAAVTHDHVALRILDHERLARLDRLEGEERAAERRRPHLVEDAVPAHDERQAGLEVRVHLPVRERVPGEERRGLVALPRAQAELAARHALDLDREAAVVVGEGVRELVEAFVEDRRPRSLGPDRQAHQEARRDHRRRQAKRSSSRPPRECRRPL
ncbi:MAG TPA: hypothetical protein VK896_00970, partial [Gaiellaceae bacterium]|nr:hypothetical protein [Gaiellaceae bacterium]